MNPIAQCADFPTLSFAFHHNRRTLVRLWRRKTPHSHREEVEGVASVSTITRCGIAVARDFVQVKTRGFWRQNPRAPKIFVLASRLLITYSTRDGSEPGQIYVTILDSEVGGISLKNKTS